MSHGSIQERNYEVVDMDVWEEFTTAAAVETNAAPERTGDDVIDGKNTLQWLQSQGLTRSEPDPSASDVPPPPPLLDGAMITGKNTLPTWGRTHTPSPRREEEKQSFHETLHPAASTTEPATVVAVAVEEEPPDVYAELTPVPYRNPNRCVPLAVMTIVSVALALGLGLYFGLAATASDGNRFPTRAPSRTVSSLTTRGPEGSTNRFPTPVPLSNVPSMYPTQPTPSMHPTMEMTSENPNLTERALLLTSYINNITLSPQRIAANGTTPECKALAWMIANDTITLDTAALLRNSEEDPIGRNAVGFRIRQRYPLLVLWFQQTAPWAITNGWLVDPNECSWYGITCTSTYVQYNDDAANVTRGTENAVTQISFSHLVSSYVGTLPEDIGLLSHLQHFEIRDTKDFGYKTGRYLRGTLPDSLGRWTALTYLDLYYNDLTGSIPNTMGQWTALSYCDMSYNRLNGSLPDSMVNWTALIHLDVGGNDLTGTLPERIGQWKALTYFDVVYNTLNGTLPESIGQWTALTYFGVNVNQFMGTLVESMGQWTALAYFGVGANDFTGTLPVSIGQWTALTYFYVTKNAFTGTIPDSIGNWSLMEGAFFQNNQLVGTMPNGICPFVDNKSDTLQVDCSVNCTCCTVSCVKE